jgi:hypothetical protein
LVELRVAVDVDTVGGDELIECFKDADAAQSELDAVRTTLVRRAHERREAEADGLRSTAAWIEKHTGTPAQTTREHLRVGERLAHLPTVAKWLDAGEISYSKVRAMTAVWSPDVADLMRRDEQLLLEQSQTLNVRDFTRAVRYWRLCATDDDPQSLRQWETRRAYLSATLDGVHHLQAVLDAESGHDFAAVLDDIDHELWLADQAAARAAAAPLATNDGTAAASTAADRAARSSATSVIGSQLDRAPGTVAATSPSGTADAGAGAATGTTIVATPTRYSGTAATETAVAPAEAAGTPAGHTAAGVSTAGIVRTPAQRRADALVEMARRAATVPSGGKRPRPLAHLLVGYDTWAGGAGAATLNGEQPISAATARRLCCDAQLARVLTDPAGAVIDLGEARKPNGPLRHLVVARDRTCRFPGCPVPAGRCAVHHIVAHHDGGPTRLGNLASLCDHHHRLVHEHGFRCNPTPGRPQTVTFQRPDGQVLGRVDLRLEPP